MVPYGPFLGVTAFADAARNAPPLRQGAKGPAVALLQGALVDLGYNLPKSVRNGAPDGAFGFETFTAVKKFQTDHKLKEDGVAGAKTITKLITLFPAKPSTPPPPASPPPPPRTDHYEIGQRDPSIKPDPGAGIWNSSPKTAVYAALKVSILRILPEASVVIGKDAAKHMAHYMGHSGSDLKIDLEGMLQDVPSARQNLEAEVAQAQEFVELLPVGTHQITSRHAEPGYNYKDENWNWFFAIGGYASWGKGVATVKQTSAGREYELDFEYCFFDRYNWDKGKSVTIFRITVTDEFMAEFHRQGYAREFNCRGSVKRRFTWKQGGRIPAQQFERSGGRS